MKRIFKSIILIFMLVILLTGCTSSDKYIKEISLDDFKEKMANKETFALYVGNENCSHCISYLPTLKSVLKEYKITIYHLDNSKLSKKEYNEFNEYLSISGTPTIAFITKCIIGIAVGGPLAVLAIFGINKCSLSEFLLNIIKYKMRPKLYVRKNLYVKSNSFEK